ncbi:hypothetical protein [Arthrobacter sp. ISL-95]|uniref:hypothetical protein n=1 Tax=Arthrobacter sp. ISL-95 TaxID=2819116 RepID=UPI001BE99A20|nr:hypothetical protein [Arthrobacter sp. ISL-95]MBT2588577.1 hypothetical protein [Arthrobacter sp. ISL-95]
MRKTRLIPVAGLTLAVALVLSACSTGRSADEEYARKYRSSVEGLDHVVRLESTYKTHVGMGSTADLFLYADSSDRDVLEGVLEDALPAVVDAAEGDPDVNLGLQVISEDGQIAVSPSDLGYEGTGNLSSYRQFLRKDSE